MQLHPISDAECLELLAEHTFGRIAIVLPDGPTIIPVNYAFIAPSIVIRTAPGSKLANAPLTMVAFEIDEVSPDHTSGWSVVARGHAFDITNAIDEYSENLRALPFHPWLAGEKAHVLKINVHVLSGRRFGPAQ